MKIKIIENVFKELNKYRFLSFFIIFVIFFALLQFSFAGSLDPDSYYHIKHAYLIRTEGLSAIQSFPWTQYSILSKYPSDIWLGYHLLLLPFTFFKDLVFGIKLSSVIFSALFCLVFYYLLNKLNIKFPFFWTGFLLLVNFSFLFRLLLPRDFIFSIICLFLSIYFIFKRKYIALFFVSWFFALTYPAAFILLGILALVYLALEIIYKKIFDFKILTSIIPGIIFGLVLRPDFPNNLKMLFVQNFLTIFYKIKGAGLNFGAELSVGFNPFDGWGLLILVAYLFLVFLIFYKFSHKTIISPKKVVVFCLFNLVLGFNLIIFTYSSIISSKLGIIYSMLILICWFILPVIGFSLLFSRKEITKNDNSFFIFYLFVLTSIFLAFSLFANRFIEYFVPLTVFSLSIIISYFFLKEQSSTVEKFRCFDLKRMIIFVLPLLFLFLSYLECSFWLSVNRYENNFYAFRETSSFLRENTKEKELILHTYWSDFPGLFYFNDKGYYISAMDPTFMYVYSEKLYWFWANMLSGTVCDSQKCPDYQKICTPQNASNIYKTIKNYFPANYFFINNRERWAIKELVYLLKSRPDLFREVPRKDYYLRSIIFEVL
ncbi:MAG: hypothetical protein WC242_02685 [Candidatus Paceibacterota bacterium]|jgi:hypothetical protein